MKIKETTKEYTCDYGHRFIGRHVKLIPFKNKSRQLISNIIFAKNEDDEFFKSGNPAEGYLLACPTCGIIQLGGFEPASDKQLVDKPDECSQRVIDLHL